MDITSYMLGKKASGGSGGQGLRYLVVEELPQVGEDNTIYLVPKSTSKTNNYYDEYMYISEEWELIGDTEIDLSNYQPLIDSTHKLSSDLVDDSNKTNKFVTEQEKSTWNSKSDFSGNYNDLTNKPETSDLLHYKGHVASSGDLPSLGQPSYPAIASSNIDTTTTVLETTQPNFVFPQNYYDQRFTNTDVAYIINNYTHYIIGRNSDSASWFGIGWNKDDQVKIKIIKDYNSSSFYIFFQYAYDSTVPTGDYTLHTNLNTWFWDRDGGTTGSPRSGNIVLSKDTTFGIFYTGFRIYTNSNVKFCANASSILGYTDSQLTGPWGMNNHRKGETLRLTDKSYIYGDNMILLRPSIVGQLNLQFSETTTQLNDVYTVGSNYQIYRRNENVQWEIWGQQNS